MTALKKMKRKDREKAAEGDKKEGGLKKSKKASFPMISCNYTFHTINYSSTQRCLDLFLKIQEYHLVGSQNTYIQHKL
jgi:hypothetical protein